MTNNKKGKLLIVDDQESICQSMAGILQLEGYEVHIATDGAQAVEKAKQISFDVAFVDMKMPGMSGLETFREIKKISPETTILLMTAYIAEDTVKEAMEEGAFACLHKPFDIEHVLDIIQDENQKPTILVVDDQHGMLEILKYCLTEMGYKVISASSGQKAIETTTRKLADVALVDIVMGEMDGIETVQKIKEMAGEDCPKVVMMSGFAAEDKIRKAFEMGAKKFLKKPITPDLLQKTIHELIPDYSGRRKPLVLLVDHDLSQCRIFSDKLTLEGYDIKTASNASSAIDEARSSHCRAILLNAKLPDVNAFVLYRQLREIRPEAGFILITGLSDDERFSEDIRKGNCTCLHRPVDTELLLNTVRSVLKSRTKKERGPHTR